MKTADPELMRAINRFHVMDVIRKRGPLSRTEISAWTELSAATVSAITAALLEDGLIGVRHEPPSGDGARGRPRVMLALEPGAAHVVGVKLAPRSVSVAVTDFAAEPLATLTMPVRCERQKLDVVADLVEDGIRHCVLDAGLDLARIHGVCVGVPGLVDTERGRSWQSPIFGPEAAPIRSAIEARLGIATQLESDGDLAAMAEHWFGHGRDVEDFIVVAVEAGVSLGVIHKGELFRGGAGISADLGWCLAGPDGRLAPPGAEPDPVTLGRAIAGAAALLALPRDPRRGRDAGRQPAGRAGARRLRRCPLPALRERTALRVALWREDVWARGAAIRVLRDLYGAPGALTGPRLVRPGGAAAGAARPLVDELEGEAT
ncbi:MAG: ROK family transcriptional regulator [Geminicoccaceae bacterium]